MTLKLDGSRPSEKELDRALHQGLKSNSPFRAWFLSRLQRGTGFADLVFCRSDYPWGKVWIDVTDQATGSIERIERECETDVLAVFESAEGNRLGVHIENKRTTGQFTPFQAELCAARAAAWVGKAKFGSYEIWETVLLAPEEFFSRNSTSASLYMTWITYEQIAEHLPLFSSGARDALS